MKHRMVATGCNEFHSSKTKLGIKSPLSVAAHGYLETPGSIWQPKLKLCAVLLSTYRQLLPQYISLHLALEQAWIGSQILQDELAVFEPLEVR